MEHNVVGVHAIEEGIHETIRDGFCWRMSSNRRMRFVLVLSGVAMSET